MTVLLVVVLIILLILVTRLSLILKYDDSGASAVLRVYFVKITLYPKGKLKEKPKEKRKEKKKKKGEEDEKKEEKERGGGFENFKEIFEIIQQILSVVRRRLLIKSLTLRYTVSCDDAAKAAIRYGSACVLMSSLIPALEGNFKIKRRDIKIGVDFTGSGSKIFARGVISLAIWEIIYIAVALFTNKSIKKLVFANK